MKKLPLYVFLVLMFCNTAQALPECEGEYGTQWTNCQGSTTYENGGKYVGEWKDGKEHGQGTFTYANGDKYVGEFKDNKFSGQGTFTYANGDKYVGGFKDDKFMGDDLNGKKLYCKGVDNLFSQHVALVFIENYQVKLSYMYVYNEQVNKEAAIHQETFGYHAGEDTITFLTGSNKILRSFNINFSLDRINLNLYTGKRLLRCKIVNYDPLEKFKEKYKKLTTPKKVKKKI